MSFRIAERQALKSTFQQHRLGAVIVKNGRILSTGYNELRYSKIIGKHTLHAEAAAIKKLLERGAFKDLAGATMYVTRFTPSGATGLAHPCPSCMELIRSVGIRTVLYSTVGGFGQVDVSNY